MRFLRTAAVWGTVLIAVGCADPGPPPASVQPGDPLPGLDESAQGRFLLGKAVFERLATPDEGLGPLFNADRCSGCHDSPTSGGTSDRVVVKAARWDETAGRCDLLRAHGGDNIQQFATPALVAAGLGPETIPDEANTRAVALAPTLYGLGLVDAVEASEIARRADPDDEDGDGISGRVGRDEEGRPGRFGRKSEVATLEQFVDAALRFELGFSTPANPVEEPVNGVPVPPSADPVGEPEIDARGLALLTDYVRFLAPPSPLAPTGPAADTVRLGEEVFGRIGCAACHTPTLRTGSHSVAALDRAAVPLYSDLLLHDLGPESAGVCGPGATPTEHRTSRLWGLRFRSAYLHDGRARTLSDAIGAHGGEGATSRSAFEALDPTGRDALLRFLQTR